LAFFADRLRLAFLTFERLLLGFFGVLLRFTAFFADRLRLALLTLDLLIFGSLGVLLLFFALLADLLRLAFFAFDRLRLFFFALDLDRLRRVLFDFDRLRLAFLDLYLLCFLRFALDLLLLTFIFFLDRLRLAFLALDLLRLVFFAFLDRLRLVFFAFDWLVLFIALDFLVGSFSFSCLPSIGAIGFKNCRVGSVVAGSPVSMEPASAAPPCRTSSLLSSVLDTGAATSIAPGATSSSWPAEG